MLLFFFGASTSTGSIPYPDADRVFPLYPTDSYYSPGHRYAPGESIDELPAPLKSEPDIITVEVG